ncbi:unnamed protein product [marine sediment metagenome]|uniref:Uncharacterized protein n=1 Tax=marine sediment metagenome TaxID=412755 RepID=X0TBD2_9ZZZZ
MILDGWDIEQDHNNYVYIWHLCDNGGRAHFTSITENDVLYCRSCGEHPPDKIDGFVRLLQWETTPK